MKVSYTPIQKKHHLAMFFSSGAPQPNPEQSERADCAMSLAPTCPPFSEVSNPLDNLCGD